MFQPGLRRCNGAVVDNASDDAVNATDTDNLPFTVHIGSARSIWENATRKPVATHLLVTPAQLHRRNVQRRLRETAIAASEFEFVRFTDVARDVNGTARRVTDTEPETETLDRIDRLALTRRILRDGIVNEDDTLGNLDVLGRVVGTPIADHAEMIERARADLEMVTGFHPERIAALKATIDDTDGATREDARDLVDGLLVLQCELNRRATETVSEMHLLRIATRVLDADPEVWSEAYPSIETLSVAGVSMLTAIVEDFLRIVATETDVDIHLYLRHGTGPAIVDQLHEQDPVSNPGEEWQ